MILSVSSWCLSIRRRNNLRICQVWNQLSFAVYHRSHMFGDVDCLTSGVNHVPVCSFVREFHKKSMNRPSNNLELMLDRKSKVLADYIDRRRSSFGSGSPEHALWIVQESRGLQFKAIQSKAYLRDTISSESTITSPRLLF